jgi:chromosome condensin MukBEF complex kleisin-like MukF subunit
MLGGVSATLMELMAVNSEHGESLMRLLGELSEACSGHTHTQTRDAVERVRVQLTRVLAWSSNRHDDWNQYFTTVNEFIRYVIQNDPENRVRSRIRDQLRRYPERPHALRLVGPDPFLQPRTVHRPTQEEVVAIPDGALQEHGLSEYAAPPPDPVDLVLDALVRRLQQDREIDLVAAVMEEGRHLSDGQWFTLLSRATPVLLRIGVAPLPLMRQEWISMSHRLQAQTLVIRAPGEPAADMTPSRPGATHAV